MSIQVAELLGDGISAELANSVRTLNSALGAPVEFVPIDWSVERRESNREAVAEGVDAVRSLGYGMKYPTETRTTSPNQVLRDSLDLAVIHRPCRTYPSVSKNFSGAINLHIVRVATGGTYEDEGRRIGSDVAVSTRVMERTPVEQAARFAFRLADSLNGSVVSASKYTIQRACDGLFEEIVKRVSGDFQDVAHRRELFDALLAKVVLDPEAFSVIVTPNEYGDFLSDMVCGLLGSVGLGASGSYSFREDGSPLCAVFDPAGGTAPDIAGCGIANPAGAIEAFGLLLTSTGSELGSSVARAVRETIGSGETTRDLGGTLDTVGFTRAIIGRLS